MLRIPGHSRRYYNLDWAARAMLEADITAAADFITLWEQRAFDVLIVRDGSRLGRLQGIQGDLCNRVIDIGARIYSYGDFGWVDENNIDAYLMAVGFSSTNSMRLLRKMRDKALSANAKSGKSVGGNLLAAYMPVRDQLTGKLISYVPDPAQRGIWIAAAECMVSQHVALKELERVLWEQHGYGEDGKQFARGKILQAMQSPTFWGHSCRKRKPRKGKWLHSVFGPWCLEPGHDVPPGVEIHYHVREPVLPSPLLEQARAEMIRRHEKSRQADRGVHAFSKLMICAECGNALTVARHGKYYRCVRSYDNLILATERCSLAGYIRSDQIQAHLHQRLEEALAHGLLAIDVTEEPTNEIELKRVQQQISELQTQAKRLATRLRTVSDEFANFLDSEIEQVSTELAHARRQETRLLHQQRTDDRRDRERALAGLRELTLERLWALPDLEINRWLHRVFGRTRLVVNAKTKEIVGRTKR